MNTKRRCRNCGSYFPTETFTYPGFHSAECMREHGKPKPSPRAPAEGKRSKRIPASVRRAVKERDHEYCRWCGDPRGGQCHHILYRSQGGPDEEWNLILLCARCHAIAHSDKGVFQPLLQGTLWLEYFHDVHLTVAQYQRWLES